MGKVYFIPISVGILRTIARYISSTEVRSDDGFLFPTKNTHSYPTYYNDKESYLFDFEGDKILSFILRKYHSSFIYERSYKKIQDVLAEIGGFIQTLYIFFLVFSYPFISKKYYEKIVNLIFNFQDSKSVKSHQLAKIMAKNKKEIISQNLDLKKENFAKSLVKIKNRPPLKLSYWEFFKGFLSTKKKNNLAKIYRGKKAVDEKLDIPYILKKFYEIDKLKMLLLNEDQYCLFEYLPKPFILHDLKIELGNSNLTFLNEETDAEVIIKAKKLFSAFEKIKKESKNSQIDKKLILMLDNNVKRMLEVIFDLKIIFTFFSLGLY